MTTLLVTVFHIFSDMGGREQYVVRIKRFNALEFDLDTYNVIRCMSYPFLLLDVASFFCLLPTHFGRAALTWLA